MNCQIQKEVLEDLDPQEINKKVIKKEANDFLFCYLYVKLIIYGSR